MCRVPYLFGRLVIGVLLVSVAAPALAQTGRISGRVLDENGDPIPGAHIRTENPAASPPVRETDVEEDGRYAMIGFISGQWRVSVSADGYNEDFGTIGVTQSGTPPVNFELTKVRHALVQALGEEAMKGLDPDEIEQQLEAADSAFNARDWNAAVSQYQSLLEKLPMLTNLRSQIGQAHRAAGNYEEALIARTRLAMGDLDAASALEASAGGLNASKEDLYNLGDSSSRRVMSKKSRPISHGPGWRWATSTRRAHSRRPRAV